MKGTIILGTVFAGGLYVVKLIKRIHELEKQLDESELHNRIKDELITSLTKTREEYYIEMCTAKRGK